MDIVREHFVITMKALQDALSRGAAPFYNEVLDSLESIAEIMQAYEKDELLIEPMERVQIPPLEEMKKLGNVERWKALEDIINACPVCASTDIEKVTILQNCTDGGGDFVQHIDGHRCDECGYTFEVDFHLYQDIEPRSSENSD